MTDCPYADIRDLLPDWVNGSLSLEVAAEVEHHLAACAACTAEADLLRALREALGTEPEVDLARIGPAVIERTLGGAMRAERRRRWRPLLGGLAVAASVALGMLLLREASAPPAALSPMAAVAPDSASSEAAPVPAPGDSGTPRDPAGAAIGEPPLRLAEAGLSVGGALADLGDEQLEAFLRRLDAMDALPQTSPAPAIITDFEVR